MNGAITVIENGLCKGDFDMGGKKLKNWDNSNYPALGTILPQAAHTVLIGPNAGGAATPTWRLATASEFGAQPQSNTLDVLSALSTQKTGRNLLEIANPIAAGYPKNDGVNPTYGWSFLTPGQLRSDINAETHTATLTTLAALTTTLTGRNLLTVADPGAISFVKINADNSVSLRTAAQMVGDLATIGGAPVSAPFLDSTAIIKSASGTNRQLKISAAGIADNTTRTMTVPNYDFTVASIAGSESLTNKNLNGLTLAVGTAGGTDVSDAITYSQTPAYPFQLSLISVGYNGASIVFRTTGATDVTFPTTGTLVSRTSTDTLTNKTLTSPAINAITGLGTVTGDHLYVQPSYLYLHGIDVTIGELYGGGHPSATDTWFWTNRIFFGVHPDHNIGFPVGSVFGWWAREDGTNVDQLFSSWTTTPTLELHRSKGAVGACTPVVLNDVLGAIAFSGHTATTATNTTRGVGAKIVAIATETFSGSTNRGTTLKLQTVGTAAGVATLLDRLTIDGTGLATFSGGVTVTGVATLANLLHITPIAFASLPIGGTLGDITVVSNSNTGTKGATISGTGAFKVIALHDGTNWTVA